MDDRRALVSSINWNEASPSFNREAGVIVDEPGTAAYFAAAFDADWEAGQGGQRPRLPDGVSTGSGSASRRSSSW